MIDFAQNFSTLFVALAVAICIPSAGAVDNSFINGIQNLSKQKDITERLDRSGERIVEVLVDAQTTFFQLASSQSICAGRLQLDPNKGSETFLEDGCNKTETAAMVAENFEHISTDSRGPNSKEQDFLKMKSAAQFVQLNSQYLSVDAVTGVRFESNRTIVVYRSSIPGNGACQVSLYSMKLGRNYSFQYANSKPICHIR